MLIKWNRRQRDKFARTWPCCDIPPNGWAVLEDNGDLVDLSPSTARCEPSGGLSEFIDDLAAAQK